MRPRIVCSLLIPARQRLLAVLSPITSGKLAMSPVKVYRLQVRSRGQKEWLTLFGSRVASAVENARLAIVAATERELIAEEDEEAAPASPPRGSC